MNDSIVPTSLSLMVVSIGESAPTLYSLEEAAGIARVHPERLRYYCRLGIFGAALARRDSEPVFTDDRLYELRRFEHFRQRHGLSQKTLLLLCGLWREVEHLTSELRYFRAK